VSALNFRHHASGLVLFIVIVTCAPGQVMFRVRDLKLKLDQSAVSKVTHV